MSRYHLETHCHSIILYFQVLSLFKLYNHWNLLNLRSQAPLDQFETRLLMICICFSRLHPHAQRLVLNGRSYLHVIYRPKSSTCSGSTCIMRKQSLNVLQRVALITELQTTIQILPYCPILFLGVYLYPVYG